MNQKRYSDVVNIIRNMNCMVPCKSGNNKAGLEVFYLRGLRICVVIKMKIGVSKPPSPSNLRYPEFVFEGYSLEWKLKKKHKKYSYALSFEDVLDSELLSEKTQEELLFHLDLFSK